MLMTTNKVLEKQDCEMNNGEPHICSLALHVLHCYIDTIIPQTQQSKGFLYEIKAETKPEI